MLFIARFEVRPGHHHLRRLHQDSHDAYVAANRSNILASGPLLRDDLGNPIGGLWYVDAKTRRDAESLCHQDPYWITGLWQSVTLLAQQAPLNAYANMRVTCL